MKEQFFYMSIFLFFSCNTPRLEESINDNSWEEILSSAISLTGIEGIDTLSVYMYYEYENRIFLDSIKSFYNLCSENDFFKYSDTVYKSFVSRKNRKIGNRLDTLLSLNIKYLMDTTGFKCNYYTMSEPMFVEEGKFIFSLARKKSANKDFERWIFLFAKEEYYRIVLFYNYQRDMYFIGKKVN